MTFINRVDYIPHPPSKPYQHQPDQYKAPEGDTDHLTTYVKDYPGRLKYSDSCRNVYPTRTSFHYFKNGEIKA